MIEARISHLAYAPEIAASMLQRQQAGAITAARQRIVEGAVGMVETALALMQRCRSAAAGRRSLWDSSRSLLRNRTCRDAARLSFCPLIGDIDFRLLFALRCATV